MLNKIKNNISIYKNEIDHKGISYFISARVRKFIYDPISYLLFKINNITTKFTFLNKKYSYHGSFYNYSWTNERTVELPIFLEIIKNNKNTLEVGNVLAHYSKINHTVVDKYEEAPGVINEDIITYRPKRKFDLIISISTLEHVGWDETPRDRDKLRQAIKHLSILLNPKGKLIFSLPVGHNPNVTRLLKTHKQLFTHTYFLKRLPRGNHWIETTYNDVKDMKYNSPLPNANALCIGIIER